MGHDHVRARAAELFEAAQYERSLQLRLELCRAGHRPVESHYNAALCCIRLAAALVGTSEQSLVRNEGPRRKLAREALALLDEAHERLIVARRERHDLARRLDQLEGRIHYNRGLAAKHVGRSGSNQFMLEWRDRARTSFRECIRNGVQPEAQWAAEAMRYLDSMEWYESVEPLDASGDAGGPGEHGPESWSPPTPGGGGWVPRELSGQQDVDFLP